MMWKPEANLLCFLCLAALLLLPPCTPQQGAESRYHEECSTEDLDLSTCGVFERCQKIKENETARCTCLTGYTYMYSICTKIPDDIPDAEEPSIGPDSSASTHDAEPGDTTKGSIVAKFLIIPACLALIGALVYYGARHYKLLQRIRQFRQNRYGSVLVTREDTDEDDVPQLA